MMTPHRILFRAIAVLAAVALAACQSEHPQQPPSEAPPSPPKLAVEMQAGGRFFANTLQAEVLLNSLGFAGRGKGAGEGGAGGAGGGGPARGIHFSGARHGGSSAPPNGASPAPHIRDSNMPPVGLHLRLTNRGSMPMQIEVTDFESDLGNFVVQPEEILLKPGESTEAEPMVSLLGVESADIPLTVSIECNGHSETQVLSLKAVPPPPPTAQ